MPISHAAATELDRTLAAIADPTRRKILERLVSGEARVTDVAAQFPISLNSVSKHIRLLERASLVNRRVVGREHLLRFQPEPLAAAQRWIGAQQAFWASRLQAIDDLLAAEDAVRPPGKKRPRTERPPSQRPEGKRPGRKQPAGKERRS